MLGGERSCLRRFAVCSNVDRRARARCNHGPQLGIERPDHKSNLDAFRATEYLQLVFIYSRQVLQPLDGCLLFRENKVV